jgi:hypothetical protein
VPRGSLVTLAVSNVRSLRQALDDVPRLLAALGLDKGARWQAGRRGALVLCPAHAENTPSCSVTLGRDRTVRVRCFGCDYSGDVLHLVARASGLDVRQDFRRVLERAAELAGVWFEHGASAPHVRLVEPPPAHPPRPEVEALWRATTAATLDDAVASWLRSRGLDPSALDALGLVRALPPGADGPRWAMFGRRPWSEQPYRAIAPVFDADGRMASVRARGVVAGLRAKAVPPAGFSTSGLVLADGVARLMLATSSAPPWWPIGSPLKLVVAEGEPDFWTWSIRAAATARPLFGVIGVTNGAWTDAIAARVPVGTSVVLRTHRDAAGEKYADRVRASLQARCVVLRGDP